MKKEELGSLNVFRIINMVWVLLFHAKIHYGLTSKLFLVDELISIGAIGVTNFIILSGFFLRLNYSTLDFDGKDILVFYKKRLFKIYPIYSVMLVVCALLKYRVSSFYELITILPVELSLTQVWFGTFMHGFLFNDNWWFLSALLTLHFLFPLLNAILNNILENKIKIFLTFSSVFISFYFYYVSISNGDVFLSYYINPLFRIPEFAVGMLMADIYVYYKENDKLGKLVWGGRTLVCIMFALSVSFLYPYIGTYYNIWNIVVIPVVVVWILYAGKDRSIFNKICSIRVVGKISSYGLYIYLSQSFSIMTIEKITTVHWNYNWFIILSVFYAILMKIYINIVKYLSCLCRKC